MRSSEVDASGSFADDIDDVAVPEKDEVTLLQLHNLLGKIHPEQSTELPSYSWKYADSDTFSCEMEEWFSYSNVGRFVNECLNAFQWAFTGEWTTATPQQQRQFILRQFLDLEHPSQVKKLVALKALTCLVAGNFHEVTSKEDQIHWMKSNCQLLCTLAVDELYIELEEVFTCLTNAFVNDSALDETTAFVADYTLTIWYCLMEVLKDDELFQLKLAALNPSMISSLVSVLASARHVVKLPGNLRKLLQLLRKAILCILGGKSSISEAKAVARRQARLNGDPKRLHPAISPMDYHQFCHQVESRFPAYIPPVEMGLPVINGTSLTQEETLKFDMQSPQPPQNAAAPVPQSIVEAGNILSSHVHISLPSLQMLDIQKAYLQYERGWIGENMEDNDATQIDKLYRSMFPHLQNLVVVLLRMALANIIHSKKHNPAHESSNTTVDKDKETRRESEIILKCVSAVLILLLKWFRVSHVMKFEYLSQLAFDSSLHALIVRMLFVRSLSSAVEEITDQPELGFFSICKGHYHEMDGVATRNGSSPKSFTVTELPHLRIPVSYSWRNFFTGYNFLRILQKLCKKKPHRILQMMACRSISALQHNDNIPQPDCQLYILKLLKAQMPYCNKKWRQANMKAITLIYLHCKSTLSEDWLHSVDPDEDAIRGAVEEKELRALIAFYHQNYAEETETRDIFISGAK